MALPFSDKAESNVGAIRAGRTQPKHSAAQPGQTSPPLLQHVAACAGLFSEEKEFLPCSLMQRRLALLSAAAEPGKHRFSFSRSGLRAAEHCSPQQEQEQLCQRLSHVFPLPVFPRSLPEPGRLRHPHGSYLLLSLSPYRYHNLVPRDHNSNH